MQINKHENINPVIQRIDDLVMSESEKLLKVLEDTVELYAGLIEIQRDRMIQSTEISFPISLAKLGELQLQAMRQKNDVLKNLTSYKSVEAAGNRRGLGELSISDLMNSAALGAAAGVGIGTKLNMSGQQPKMIDSNGIESSMIDVQIETVVSALPTPEETANIIMRDFKQ